MAALPPRRPNAGFLKQLLSWEKERWGETSELPEEFLRGKPVLSSEKQLRSVFRVVLRTGEVRPPTAGQVQILGHDITAPEGMMEACVVGFELF